MNYSKKLTKDDSDSEYDDQNSMKKQRKNSINDKNVNRKSILEKIKKKVSIYIEEKVKDHQQNSMTLLQDEQKNYQSQSSYGNFSQNFDSPLRKSSLSKNKQSLQIQIPKKSILLKKIEEKSDHENSDSNTEQSDKSITLIKNVIDSQTFDSKNEAIMTGKYKGQLFQLSSSRSVISPSQSPQKIQKFNSVILNSPLTKRKQSQENVLNLQSSPISRQNKTLSQSQISAQISPLRKNRNPPVTLNKNLINLKGKSFKFLNQTKKQEKELEITNALTNIIDDKNINNGIIVFDKNQQEYFCHEQDLDHLFNFTEIQFLNKEEKEELYELHMQDYLQYMPRKVKIDLNNDQDLEGIIYILNKKEDKKNSLDILILEKAFRDLPFFKSLDTQNEKVFHQLLKNIKHQFSKQNDILFHEGDEASSFYFILKGKVEVLQKDQSNQTLINNNIEIQQKIAEIQDQNIQNIIQTLFEGYNHVGTIKEGQFFGEIALRQSIQRTATIICSQDCHFAVMNKQTFNNCVKKYQQDYEDLQFMKTLPIFQNILESDIDLMKNNMKIHELNIYQYLFKPGDLADSIYIIKSGEVELSIKIDQHQYDTNIIFDERAKIINKQKAIQQYCQENKIKDYSVVQTKINKEYYQSTLDEKNIEMSYFNKDPKSENKLLKSYKNNEKIFKLARFGQAQVFGDEESLKNYYKFEQSLNQPQNQFSENQFNVKNFTRKTIAQVVSKSSVIYQLLVDDFIKILKRKKNYYNISQILQQYNDNFMDPKTLKHQDSLQSNLQVNKKFSNFQRVLQNEIKSDKRKVNQTKIITNLKKTKKMPLTSEEIKFITEQQNGVLNQMIKQQKQQQNNQLISKSHVNSDQKINFSLNLTNGKKNIIHKKENQTAQKNFLKTFQSQNQDPQQDNHFKQFYDFNYSTADKLQGNNLSGEIQKNYIQKQIQPFKKFQTPNQKVQQQQFQQLNSQQKTNLQQASFSELKLEKSDSVKSPQTNQQSFMTSSSLSPIKLKNQVSNINQLNQTQNNSPLLDFQSAKDFYGSPDINNMQSVKSQEFDTQNLFYFNKNSQNQQSSPKVRSKSSTQQMNLIRPVSAFQAHPQNSQISQNFQKQNVEISRQKNNNQSKTFYQNNENKSKQITQQSPKTQRARPKRHVEITEFTQIVDEETQKALESPIKSKRIMSYQERQELIQIKKEQAYQELDKIMDFKICYDKIDQLTNKKRGLTIYNPLYSLNRDPHKKNKNLRKRKKGMPVQDDSFVMYQDPQQSKEDQQTLEQKVKSENKYSLNFLQQNEKLLRNKVPLIKDNDDKDINLLDVFRREFRSNTKQKSGLIAQAQRHNFNPARFYMRPEKKDEYFSQYLDTHDNNISILQQKKLLKQQINLDLDPKIDLSQQISNLFETLQNQNLFTNQGDEQEQNNKINAIQSQKEKKRPQTCNNSNNVKNQRVQNLNQGQNVKQFGVYKTSLKPKTAQPKQQRSQSIVNNVENQNQNQMQNNIKYGFDSIIQSQRDWQTYDVDQQQMGNLKTSQNRKSTFARINSASTDSQLRNSILTNYQTPNLLSSEIKISLDQNAPQI